MYFSLLDAERRRGIAALAREFTLRELSVRASSPREDGAGRAVPSRPAGASRSRVAAALARLLTEAPWELLARGDFAAYCEHVQYTARRLAKLRAPLHRIGEALLAQSREAEERLAARRGRGRRGAASPSGGEVRAALDALRQVAFLEAAKAYDGVQRAALAALLGVLNAELEAAGPEDLLRRLLDLAARAFAAPWAGIWLLEAGADGRRRLTPAATRGAPGEFPRRDAPAGRFFYQVLRGGRPAFPADAANDPRVGQPYFRTLEAKSLWAAPLSLDARRGGALGVLHVAFEREFECLPRERDLLRAFARRSALAIERARLLSSISAAHARARRLSRELVRAQERERRRIGRDLHDAAGQTFMATRLYLEMAQRQLAEGGGAAAARRPIRAGLASVDAGIGELRRIISDLAPSGLEQGGLAAALRRLTREFQRASGVAASLRLRLPAALPREVEVLAFRFAQEGLTNIARHAHARRAWLSATLNATLSATLSATSSATPTASPSSPSSPTSRAASRDAAGARASAARGGDRLILRLRDDGLGLAAMLEGEGARSAETSGGEFAAPDGRRTAGAGKDPARVGFGLRAMRERIELAGGELRLSSPRGGGLELIAVLPLTPAPLAAGAVPAAPVNEPPRGGEVANGKRKFGLKPLLQGVACPVPAF